MYTPYGDESLGDLLVHLLMPAVTLGLVASSVIARLTRTSMLVSFVRTTSALLGKRRERNGSGD